MADPIASIAHAATLVFWIWFLTPRSWVQRYKQRKNQRSFAAQAQRSTPHALVQAILAPHPLPAAQAARMRPLLLHWLGVRGDLDATQLAKKIPETLCQRWFTLDISSYHGNHPQAALAYACLRCAFYLRAAARLGWLPADQYLQLTHLNARRARECFADWPTFCHACHLGRAQWHSNAGIRTDVFGPWLQPEAWASTLWEVA